MQSGFNQPHVERMQAAAAARLNKFHTAKRQLLGNKIVPAPAWKTNVINGTSTVTARNAREAGSKIFLSRLPIDVTPQEVEDLFKKTIGPLKEMFLVYNNQGKSKGMAVVTFARPGDAVLARQKYDGKIVDGRRKIKIEVIYDGVPSSGIQTSNRAPSLLDRLGGKLPDGPPSAPAALKAIPAVSVGTMPGRRVRFKKGPKRLKKNHLALAGMAGTATTHVKKGPVSKDDLDKEMEDYRAAAAGP